MVLLRKTIQTDKKSPSTSIVSYNKFCVKYTGLTVLDKNASLEYVNTNIKLSIALHILNSRHDTTTVTVYFFYISVTLFSQCRN